MKNLNNLIQLTKKANQQPVNYTLDKNQLENVSGPYIVDTQPVVEMGDNRQVKVETKPNLTLNTAGFKPITDITQPITLTEDIQDYYKKSMPKLIDEPWKIEPIPEKKPDPTKIKEKKQAWYETLENWIKENPWAAGAGALGLGGLGYYLLSDDDDEEEEEEE